MMRDYRLAAGQRGVTMAVALVILIGVSVVSLSALTTTMWELVMAGSEEARMSAFHRAQNGIDAAIVNSGNFPVGESVGYRNCTSGFASKYDETCDDSSVTLPSTYDATDTEVAVVVVAPADNCPPRVMSTSCENFTVASFSIDSRHDATAARGGRADLMQGYLVLLPKFQQGG